MTEHSLVIVLDAAKFLLGTVVGALIVKWVDGKSDLISYFGHVSAFTIRNNDQNIFLHTHEVVLRNAGKKPATNIRLTHNQLPDQFNISPSIPYTIETLPDGRKDIVIPVLIPQQQILIAYMYAPPLTFNSIHGGIRSNEGFATPVEMELSEKNSAAFTVFAVTMFLIGCGTMLYWAWLISKFFTPT